jgi:hypothetical protein
VTWTVARAYAPDVVTKDIRWARVALVSLIVAIGSVASAVTLHPLVGVGGALAVGIAMRAILGPWRRP